MPLYDFACDSCGVQIEKMLPMEHELPECPKCGSTMRRFFSKVPRYHAFRKGWWEHIAPDPIYIESKKQLKEETRKRGLTSEYAEG